MTGAKGKEGRLAPLLAARGLFFWITEAARE